MERLFYERFDEEQRKRLQRLEGEPGLWWLLFCNANRLVDPNWDREVIVGLMEEEWELRERGRKADWRGALSLWIEWHERHGALLENEAAALQSIIRRCRSPESCEEAFRVTDDVRQLLSLIMLGAFARIGLLVEEGLAICHEQRTGERGDRHLLDDLVAEPESHSPGRCAFERYLMRARNWLTSCDGDEVSWNEFASRVMPRRISESGRPEEDLRRGLNVWRAGINQPKPASLRQLTANLAQEGAGADSEGIANELLWSAHLAVATDRCRAILPANMGGLVPEAVRRQRVQIAKWLP